MVESHSTLSWNRIAEWLQQAQDLKRSGLWRRKDLENKGRTSTHYYPSGDFNRCDSSDT
jgi:hypothetical protein